MYVYCNYVINIFRMCFELMMPILLRHTLAEKDTDRYHYILCLLIGLRSLSQQDLTMTDLDTAQTLIMTFYELTEEFGDLKWATIKLHCLSHVQVATRRCGNLFSCAMNQFEVEY